MREPDVIKIQIDFVIWYLRSDIIGVASRNIQ